MIGTCAGLFLLMLDSTVVALALPSIRHDVGATSAGLQWVMNGYLLAITIFVVTAGRLGDMFGRKRLFLLGMVVFALGSVLSGSAGDQETLIAGRILQGVGAAPMVTPHQPGEDGQHQAPQHDRSLQGRPGTGDVEGKRGGAGVITGDVRQREVVEDQRHLQDPHGRHRPGQRQARRRGEVANGGVVAAQGGGVSSTTHHQPGGASRGGDECGQPDERQHQGAKPPPSSGTE